MIDPEAAFYARAAPSAALIALIGAKSSGKADLQQGWPGEIKQLSDAFVSFFMPSGVQRPAIGEFTIQTDLWVPPSIGDLVHQIDQVMLELYNETQWFHSGARIWSVDAGFGDYPAPPDKPMRRRRNYRLTVS